MTLDQQLNRYLSRYQSDITSLERLFNPSHLAAECLFSQVKTDGASAQVMLEFLILFDGWLHDYTASNDEKTHTAFKVSAIMGFSYTENTTESRLHIRTSSDRVLVYIASNKSVQEELSSFRLRLQNILQANAK